LDRGPRIDSYEWSGGREAMLRWGPEGGPIVLASPPLFEEANRFRSVLTATMRALAAKGIGGAVPDLPGTGESVVPTRDARLPNWRAAFAAAAESLPGPVHVLAIRGGTLVDGDARAVSRWTLSPVEGSTLVRELRRARGLSAEGLYAGNELADDLLIALETAEPTITGPVRVVRSTTDPRPADLKVAFEPPWRAAEPRRDDALAQALAADIAEWITSCES
jgi:hypothetical protein